MGDSVHRFGGTTVLLITRQPISNQDRDSISFTPTDVHVLNEGSTDEAIVIIGERAIEEGIGGDVNPTAPAPSTGDQLFVGNLPSGLRDLGRLLLRTVRTEINGELKYHPLSKKFVETPDNFWTVRIQPRDLSFRITVRGRPENFVPNIELALENGMMGYSNFKISSKDQLPAFMSVLRQATKRG